MTKLICDCCGKEVDKFFRFSYYVHIKDMKEYRAGHVDRNLNPISGREETEELCIECYNKIVIAAYSKFIELRGTNEF